MSLCAPTRFTKIDPLSRDPFFASIQQQDPSLSLLPDSVHSTLNRYPSPTHFPIKSRLASLRGVPGPDYVFLGVGSDEVIDLVMRVTCRPGKDKILVCPPTYGMYGVTAQVNDVDVVKVDLDTEEGRFGLRVDEVRPFLSFCSSLIGLFSIYPTSLLSLLGQ
jgi:histidinol-phosphate aminotransferase